MHVLQTIPKTKYNRQIKCLPTYVYYGFHLHTFLIQFVVLRNAQLGHLAKNLDGDHIGNLSTERIIIIL